MAEWTITPENENSQSSTFMPLICSVIDGFHVTFPDGYERIFDSLCVHGVPFRNFKHFQEVLKESVRKTIGDTTSTRFKRLQDHPYHLQPSLQESILGDGTPHKYDGFYTFFIIQLKKNLSGKKCVVVDTGHAHEASRAETESHRVHERKPHRVVAHTTRADRRPHRVINMKWYAMDEYGGQEDYSDEVNRQINEQIGSDNPPFMTTINGDTYLIDPNGKIEENVSTKQQRVILKKDPILSPRWYYPDDHGNLTPYPDAINHDIMKTKKGEGLLINIRGVDYFINPFTKTETNSRTGESRRIVYEGGNKKTKRTKRRRSLYKRTRHHA